jgi:hypothetical protein
MAEESVGDKGQTIEGRGSGRRSTVASGLKVALISAGAAIVGAAFTFAGVYYTGWFNYASKDEEFRFNLVKLAAGILNIPKADAQAQPRNWPIDVMIHYSGISMNDDERKLLVELGGLKGVPVIAAAPATPNKFICVPSPSGRFLKYYYDSATGSYTGGPNVVDASGCQ